MKHTNFYSQLKEIDNRIREELKAAIKAHGIEYTFIHTDRDDEDEDIYDLISEETNRAPIILASTHYTETSEDYYVTHVELDIENDDVFIYGFPTNGCSDDVCELEFIAHGHLEYIIDQISETDEVQDVSIP